MYIGNATGFRRATVVAVLVAAVIISGLILNNSRISEAEAGFCRSVSESLISVLPVSSFLGKYCGAWLWLAVSAVMIAVPRTRFLGFAVLTCVIITLLAGDVVIKHIIERSRPYAVLDTEPLMRISTLYSYPSVHTALPFAVAAVLCRRSKRAAAIVAIFGVAVGISRITVLAHFPTDIIFGAILGIAIGIAVPGTAYASEAPE